MFLISSFTKTTKMDALLKWSPKLRTEKTLNHIDLLLGQWPDFKIISRKCSSVLCLLIKIAKMNPLGWTIDQRPENLCRVFFPCWCFTGSSFLAGWLFKGSSFPSGASQISYFKVLPWHSNKMATFNRQLSSHDKMTSTLTSAQVNNPGSYGPSF